MMILTDKKPRVNVEGILTADESTKSNITLVTIHTHVLHHWML